VLRHNRSRGPGDIGLTGLHVQPRLAVGDVSARQALIPLVTKNQMLRPTAPTARRRPSPRHDSWGKRAAGDSLTTVGLRPPSVSLSPALSHPDCRSVLTLIVAGQLYAVSAGKAILAHMPDAVREEYFSQVIFERITPKTISSKAELRREIANVQRQGFAHSLDEFTLGIVGISVPILTEGDFPLGALNIAMPSVRYTPETRDRAVKVLTGAAKRIRRQYLLESSSSRRASPRRGSGTKS
jgi:hypothetical protein